MAPKMVSLIFFCVFLAGIQSICFYDDEKVLSCSGELDFDYYVLIEKLYLYDSYISEADLQKFFPNVREVHVEGRFLKRTCQEIASVVKTTGCKGKI